MNKEMNAKQEARLNMQRGTEQHIDANQTIVASNAAFQTAFTRFKANIAAILNAAQQKSAPRTGVAADKTAARQTLCRTADTIAGYIFAYASSASNNTLKNEMDTTYAKLFKIRDEELAPRCQNIHDRGAENLSALADFGVTAALLANLQTAIDNYSAITPKPRTALSERKTNTANIAALLDANDHILEDQLDRLIELFRPANPDFVQTYETIRNVVKPASRPRKPRPPADKKDGETPK